MQLIIISFVYFLNLLEFSSLHSHSPAHSFSSSSYESSESDSDSSEIVDHHDRRVMVIKMEQQVFVNVLNGSAIVPAATSTSSSTPSTIPSSSSSSTSTTSSSSTTTTTAAPCAKCSASSILLPTAPITPTSPAGVQCCDANGCASYTFTCTFVDAPSVFFAFNIGTGGGIFGPPAQGQVSVTLGCNSEGQWMYTDEIGFNGPNGTKFQVTEVRCLRST